MDANRPKQKVRLPITYVIAMKDPLQSVISFIVVVLHVIIARAKPVAISCGNVRIGTRYQEIPTVACAPSE